MSVGLIGYGYWGKILEPNIKKVFGESPVIHDPLCGISNEKAIENCTHVFVATPAGTHFSIASNLLQKNKKVFCEKPLSVSRKEVDELFYQSKLKNKASLFVDWVFTFNDAVNHIKKIYDSGKYGKLRSVSMNRMNSGPERKDVSAKWDLSSHDVSILQYIFKQKPTSVSWRCFKRNSDSFRSDTCIGVINYEGFDALINSSWSYGKKNRECVFEFDAGFLHWDDSINSLRFEGHEVEFAKTSSPLENSIKNFKAGRYNHEDLTKEITEILEVGE